MDTLTLTKFYDIHISPGFYQVIRDDKVGSSSWRPIAGGRYDE